MQCCYSSTYYFHAGVRNSITTQLQLEVVDTYMKLCCYKEEESLIEHEMISYLAYYKDVVWSGLSSSLAGTYICASVS